MRSSGSRNSSNSLLEDVNPMKNATKQDLKKLQSTLEWQAESLVEPSEFKVVE